MLKIKDNVDLNELEKFGFRRPFHAYTRIKYGNQIYVNAISRIISYRYHKHYLRDAKDEHVKDLIQAGLVEKVE